MGQRVAGIAYIKVDGTQLSVTGTIEIPIAPTLKEAKMGLTAPAGYKETAQRPYLKIKSITTPDFPRAALANGTNMSLTAELANGMVYYLSGAWLEGENKAEFVEGEVDLEFSGLLGTFA